MLARHASQHNQWEDQSEAGSAISGSVASPGRSTLGNHGGETHLFTGIDDASSVGGGSSRSHTGSHGSAQSSRIARRGQRKSEAARAR